MPAPTAEPTQPSSPEPLVTVDALDALLRTGAAVVLDVRYRLGGPPGRAAYEEGHVPGAVFVDMDTDLADPPGEGRGRHPLPDPERFAAAMRRAGVRRDRPVLVYDAADGTAAARAWWLLTYHGHPDVRLLDGGWAAWVEAGLPVSDETPAPVEGDFASDPGHLRLLDAEGAARAGREAVLLDARAAERFRGEVEPIDPVAGHVPGARSVPTSENVDASGRWKPVTDLSARFAAVGAVPGADVAVYCGSGVTAAHEVLALRLSGVDAALYAGSWSEWVSDPERPVATGDTDAG